MNLFYKSILFFITLNCLSTFSFANHKNDQTSFEENTLKILSRTFQEFEKKIDSNQNSNPHPIWPHFNIADYPSIIHFANGHVYILGESQKFSLFSSQWEKIQINHYPVLFSQNYSKELPAFQLDFKIEGQNALIFKMNEDSFHPYMPLLTFIHERFHLYQFDHFEKEAIESPIESDYLDSFLLAWMEIEQRLLTLFLQSQNSSEKSDYLKYYLSLNKKRRSLIHPQSAKWEDHQQKMEGLADYISIKTLESLALFSQFHPEEALLEMRKMKNAGLISTQQDAIKGRHYFVGAVLGRALDFCGSKDWKNKIEKENISLISLLENLFPMDENEIEYRVNVILKNLKIDLIHNQIKCSIEKSQEERTKIYSQFSGQKGVLIVMGIPSGRMSSGGRHKKSYPVNSRQKVLVEDTSLSISQDQSWKLNFRGMPYVFEEQNGKRIFKLGDKTEIKIDGENYSIQKILEQSTSEPETQFSYISMKNEHCELESTRSGRMSVRNGNIEFQFD